MLGIVSDISQNSSSSKDNFLSRILVSSLIFLAPLSMGPVLFFSSNYFYIMMFVGFCLFLVQFNKLIYHRRILNKAFTICSVIFALSFFLSMVFGLSYQDMLSKYTTSVMIGSFSGILKSIILLVPTQLFLTYLIYLSINNIEDILYYFRIFLYSGFLMNFIAIIAILVGFGNIDEGRMGLTFFDSNYLGRFEVIILSIILIYLLFSRKSLMKRLILIINIFLCLLIIILSASRAALLSFVVISTILVFFSNFKAIKYAIISINFLIFSYLIVIIASRRGAFVTGGDTGILSSFIDISNTTRLALNYSAVQMFLDHPIFGIGYHNFYNVYINHNYIPDFIPVALGIAVIHSWFFANLAELGLFGTIPFCIIIYLLIRKILYNIRNPINENYRFCGLLIFSLIFIFLFFGMFFPVFYPEVLFPIVFGLSGGYLKTSIMDSQVLTNEKLYRK